MKPSRSLGDFLRRLTEEVWRGRMLRMRHGTILITIGTVGVILAVGAITDGAAHGRWHWIREVGLGWFALNLIVLGVAHERAGHGLFGKRPDGTLPLWSKVVFLPLYVVQSAVWHLVRLGPGNPRYQVVAPGLILGRRPWLWEDPPVCATLVDLTSEYQESARARRHPGYRCLPLLDGSAPSPAVLVQFMEGLPPGDTFVHCAQGHGRAGLFAVVWLLRRGGVPSVDEALKAIKAVRPRVNLNSRQRRCAEGCVPH